MGLFRYVKDAKEYDKNTDFNKKNDAAYTANVADDTNEFEPETIYLDKDNNVIVDDIEDYFDSETDTEELGISEDGTEKEDTSGLKKGEK